jgi:uncharacterized Tic20 family protein
MAKKEETPEPAEKPESETPKPAEKPEVETPAEQETSAEQPEVVQEGPGSKEVNKDARMWAMICHLSALAGLVVPVIGCIIGPLVIWQIKKEEFPFLDEQGKEAVNFQISILIYGIVAGLLCFVCVGFVLLPAVAVFDLIFLLIAAVKANDGHHYRYPLTIRFIK